MTPARIFAETLAKTLSRSEIRRFDRALQNIELAADKFCLPGAAELYRRLSAGVLMDTVADGQMLIVYADAHHRGCQAIANPPICLVTESLEAAARLSSGQRHRTLVARSLSLLPQNRPQLTDQNDELAAVASEIIGLAGLLLSRRDLDAIKGIKGAIPAIAIAARTETRVRPSVSTKHIVTRFPGDWLGTIPSAGRA